MSVDRHHILKAWIAAILWLIVISIESTAYLSAHNTSRILYPLLHFFFGVDHAHFDPWHFYIRKGGHVFGYGLLCILLFRAWRETLPTPGNPKWTFRWASIAVLGTALVASLEALRDLEFDALLSGHLAPRLENATEDRDIALDALDRLVLPRSIV